MKIIISLCILSIIVYAQTAVFPGAIATNDTLLTATNRAQTTTTASIDASTLTIPVALGTVFTAPTNVTIDNEIIKICTVGATTLTACVGGRGFDNSTAAAHTNATFVRGNINAWFHNATKAEIIAIETFLGVNGTSAPYASLTATNTFTGRQNATGAASTAPAKTGTSLPGTCVVGDLFFKSDATAGQNIYQCQSTNTWTQQLNSGGGSGITTCLDATGSTTAYTCPSAVGYTLATGARATFQPQTTNTTTTPTVAIQGGLAKTIINSDGTALVAGQLVGLQIYDLAYDGTNQVVLGEHLAAGATGGLTIVRTTNPPTVDIVTAVVPQKAASNTWTGANDFSGASTTSPSKAGVSASIPATCTVGQTYYKTDVTAGQNLFGCTSVNTWTLLGGTYSPFDWTSFPPVQDRFCGTSTVAGPTLDVGFFRWRTDVVAGSQTFTLSGDANHPCYWQMVTGGSSGDGSTISPMTFASQPQLGFAYGNDGTWETQIVFTISAVATSDFGFGFIVNPGEDVPTRTTNVIRVRKLSSDATFVFEACDATPTCSSSNSTVTAADNTTYTARVRSTSAGTIRFSISTSGGAFETEVTRSTNIPTVTLYPGATFKTAAAATKTIKYYGFAFAKTGMTP